MWLSISLHKIKIAESKADSLIHSLRTHQYSTNSVLLKTANIIKESFQSETEEIKDIIAQNIKETWLHGQFPHSTDEKLVDKEQSYWWLSLEM